MKRGEKERPGEAESPKTPPLSRAEPGIEMAFLKAQLLMGMRGWEVVRWGVRAAWGGAALHRPQLCRHCPKPPDSLGLSQVYGAQRVMGLLGPWTEQQGHSKGRASPRPTFTQAAWHPHLTGSGQNLAREMETCPVKPTPPSPRRSLCLLLRGWACLKGWGQGKGVSVPTNL